MGLINGADTECRVDNPDGTDGGSSLTPREVAVVEAVDAFLRANAAFSSAYLSARLALVESNRMLDESRRGRFYLRYQHAGGVTEFWGHVSHKPSLDFKAGVVGVVISNETPPATPQG